VPGWNAIAVDVVDRIKAVRKILQLLRKSQQRLMRP